MKIFSKYKYNKTNKKLDYIAASFLFVGVIFVILSFVVGNGFSGKGKNPKNYYGTYYAVTNSNFYTLKIGEKGCTLTISTGRIEEEVITDGKYDYYVASYAQKKVPDSKKYKSCPAIVVYKDGNSEYSATTSWVFWITSESPYKFASSTKDGEVLKFTSTPYNLSKLMGDPKSYYGTYQLNSENGITFYKDGYADFTLNGEKRKLKYFYVNKAWLDEQSKDNTYNSALIVYSEYNSDETYVFGYIDENTLALKRAGEYKRIK